MPLLLISSLAAAEPSLSAPTNKTEQVVTNGDDEMTPAERYFLSLLGSRMTREEFLERRAAARALQAEADQHLQFGDAVKTGSGLHRRACDLFARLQKDGWGRGRKP